MGVVKKLVQTIAKIVLSVREHEDKDLKDYRLSVCRKCDKYDQENDKCTVCGCWMDIKTGLATNKDPELMGEVVITHCPLGRWGDLELANIYREIKGQEPL